MLRIMQFFICKESDRKANIADFSIKQFLTYPTGSSAEKQTD